MSQAKLRGAASATVLAILGCGGKTDPSSFATSPASVAPPAAPTCVTCTIDSDCADVEGKCAVPARGGGSGICAPVCSKEGFCTPDRMCVAASDPSGNGWMACVLRGTGCGGK